MLHIEELYQPSFALISSVGNLAGRSEGEIWKATFRTAHWQECMIRPQVNRGRIEDQSQLSQS